MKLRIITVGLALAINGCDREEAPTEIRESPSQKASYSQSEIEELGVQLGEEQKRNTELQIEFERKKTALLSEIEAARDERKQIVAAQDAYLVLLKRQADEELQKLKEANQDLAIWDPMPIDSSTELREVIQKVINENRELRKQLEGTAPNKPCQ